MAGLLAVLAWCAVAAGALGVAAAGAKGLRAPGAGMGPGEIRAVAAGLLVAAWLVVTWSFVRGRPSRNGVRGVRWCGWRPAAGLGVTSIAVAVSPAVTTAQVVPVADVVAPSVAWSVVRRILALRREQMRTLSGSGQVPRRLTPAETRLLGEVSALAAGHDGTGPADDPPVPEHLAGLLDAATATEPVTPPRVTGEWTTMVCLLGEPCVVNRAGERAVFAKRRSLELICWMVLNRDRSTRSAARTAMWESDVADSTFSTVVSEMRRAVRSVSPPGESPSVAVSPVTYDDGLPLSGRVVTDVEVLDGAVERALGDPSQVDGVVAALGLVRDLPFAGTSFLWADLDGSTTRIVLSVMRAVDLALAEGARLGRTGWVLAATRAGLRLFPGDERLLGISRDLVGVSVAAGTLAP